MHMHCISNNNNALLKCIAIEQTFHLLIGLHKGEYPLYLKYNRNLQHKIQVATTSLVNGDSEPDHFLMGGAY